ncbi:MAG: 50S ribosomal protein L3 [Patescibacteria group bacterium]|nr:50S ribosomal protein L3 [Patescibacteria group bacterium]
MLNTIFGFKKSQTQKFQTDGIRVPITEVDIPSNSVVMVKAADKHGYTALQLGIGTKKKAKKRDLGQIRGANLKTAPRFLREVRITDQEDTLPGAGDLIKVSDLLKPGDIVDVIGVSKGKGYAGVVKRHHFKGGPRTHGQSDRERAPGSIGQTTTPGRVYKGKRMAGRMGSDRVTVKNLKVMAVTEDSVLIKGLVPGILNSLVEIRKVGEDKKFTPLIDFLKADKASEEKPEEVKEKSEQEEKVEENKQEEIKEEKNG